MDGLTDAFEAAGVSLVNAAVPALVPATRVPVPLYQVLGANRVCVSAGLLPVVVGWFAARGISILSNDSLSVLPPPADVVAGTGAIFDPVLLETIRAQRGVVVRYDAAHVDPAALCGQIARAWSGRRIVVACARKAEVRRVVHGLKSLGVPAGAAHGDGRLVPPELSAPIRVWVATWRGVGAPHVDAPRASITVLYNAREALGEVPTERVARESHHRVVGLLGAHESLSDYERDRLWSLLGTARPVYIPRHGLVRCPVRVVHVANHSPLVPPDREGLDLLRQGVWGHPARNRRLARLARLLGEGDRDRLNRQFPEVGRVLGNRTVGRIWVLVSVAEHARVLGRLMRAAVYLGVSPSTLPSEPPTSHGPDSGGASGIVVVTPDALGAAVLGGDDVIVRADAGAGLPPGLRPEHLYAAHPASELVVVDADDRHHPALRRQARERERAYHAEGWAVGPDPCWDALRAFEATRPGGRP
jgi:hypothetical protein